MSALQHRVSEFLTFELHHTLGAYRHAAQELRGLEKRLEDDRALLPQRQGAALLELTKRMRMYNHQLDVGHDASNAPTRHPPPEDLPLSSSMQPLSEDASQDVTARLRLSWVCAFYEAALHALDRGLEEKLENGPLADFADALLDPRVEMAAWERNQASPSTGDLERRRTRYRERLDEAARCRFPMAGFGTCDDTDLADVLTPLDIVTTIIESHLEVNHKQPLSWFILEALEDAHLAMHEAESRLTAPLAGLLELDRGEMGDVERTLRRSIATNTFVWAVARVAPWIFAEDDNERQHVVRYYDRAWRNNMPMRAMWISAQVSLLALHRRAYAYGLLKESTLAYKDFHKLQHHVRLTSRRIERASLRVAGASEYLEALDASADHHIGELYRRDRDHTTALMHYKRAFGRLQRLMREREHLVLVNSRWLVQLQLSLGKSSYELGQHKSCLLWYLRTWRSLLDLIAEDTAGEVNPAALDSALAWLVRIVDEPDLHKRDVVSYLRPVVDQIDAFRVDPRFTGLASEVLLHLGHLLFVLYLSEYPQGAHPPHTEGRDGADPEPCSSDEKQEIVEPPQPALSLALMCVRRAWQLDRARTLAVSDLLKLYFREMEDHGEVPSALERALEETVPIGDAWPRGANTAQSMSRAIEYVLLQQMRLTPSFDDTGNRIARDLLHGLLSHTDSIEARKSHVYDYLTRGPTESGRLTDLNDGPLIEFICLRRYSSAYPILPVLRHSGHMGAATSSGSTLEGEMGVLLGLRSIRAHRMWSASTAPALRFRIST
jgi:tetratricopeptide (TPR) repeat protein